MSQTYETFVNELFKRERSGMRPGIEGVRDLLSFVGNPEKRLKTIHVAGSNGKGSTAAMLESILRNQGLRTGLFTSPHIMDFRERIRIAGKMIEKEKVEEFLTACSRQIRNGKNSFFEIATALAFDTFSRDDVDIGIIEVGLGGRLDSTNVVEPLVSIITTIGLEHTDILGDTLSEIAIEKAGILKNNGILLTSLGKGKAFDQLRLAALEKKARFIPVGETFPARLVSNSREGVRFQAKIDGHNSDFFLPLPGRHQVQNASCSIAAACIMKEDDIIVDEESIRKGLSAVRWPGRLEIHRIGKDVVFDVAHNPQAARALKNALSEIFPGREIQCVIGMLDDKDHKSFGKALLQVIDELWLAEPDTGRALPADELANRFAGFKGILHIEKSVPTALRQALQSGDGSGVLLVTGSFYVVGEAMKELGMSVPEQF
ncbi:MAG: folylpolyglutamate synthase/dihydrofolate synthase family protein [Candidatus Eisenbacteria bacterium]|nr:folylpolyglutamate synthase/dihydrofolate synthase family protein [Candidatus Eisenbacteria bacterium]